MPEKVIVEFKPEGKILKVEKGRSILNIAASYKVYIPTICGGKGECGKCKVIVKGKFSVGNVEALTREERKMGYSLACQTFVEGDCEVTVPEVSKVGRHQILTKSERPAVKLNPRLKHVFLVLQPPSLSDTTNDWDRVKQSLSKHGFEKVTVPIPLLKKLPKLLRDCSWQLTLYLFNLGDMWEVIAIDVEMERPGLGLAIDIGTTTIVAELIDLKNGEILAIASDYNKQVLRGEDVLSRITYADEGGLSELSNLALDTINYLIEELLQKTGMHRDRIMHVVVSGNTTMLHLLYKVSPTHLRLEPYIPVATMMPLTKGRNIGLHINQHVYIYSVPGRSSYVGGDITADIIASNMHLENALSLLIDVGTNGEIVLGNKDWLVACSCSAGPAFEGGEVDFGIRAMEGAIENVEIGPELDVKYSTIGNVKPKGICGSGLIDLLAELFFNRVIDKAGKIQNIENRRIREGDEGKEFILVWAKETNIGKDMTISEVDIKNIIRTKAAVFGACSFLVKNMGYEFSDIERLYIAGGFGNYLNVPKSILLGLFPDLPAERYRFIGNGALAGARMILLSEEKRKEGEEVARKMTHIELSVSSKFFDEYTSALFLPHTDMKLFPCVEKMLRMEATSLSECWAEMEKCHTDDEKKKGSGELEVTIHKI